MKRTILAGTALLSLMGAAFAADLAVVEPVVQPTYAPEPIGWGGLYIGGHAGYGWANRDGYFGSPFFECDGRCDDVDFDYDQEGWLAGGQIGYNYMFNNNFLVGLEVDASLADIDGTLEDAFGGVGEWTWLSTATARVGYAADRFMLYAEGGLGLGGFEFENLIGCSFSQNRSGYVVGGGAEWKITQRAILKAEYNYMDFGSEKQACVAFNELPVYMETDANMHVVKIGFNYLLGGQ